MSGWAKIETQLCRTWSPTTPWRSQLKQIIHRILISMICLSHKSGGKSKLEPRSSSPSPAQNPDSAPRAHLVNACWMEFPQEHFENPAAFCLLPILPASVPHLVAGIKDAFRMLWWSSHVTRSPSVEMAQSKEFAKCSLLTLQRNFPRSLRETMAGGWYSNWDQKLDSFGVGLRTVRLWKQMHVFLPSLSSLPLL